MTFSRRLKPIAIFALMGGVFMGVAPGHAQDQNSKDEAIFEKDPPQRDRSGQNSPRSREAIQKRIEELRAKDPQDPRIAKLEKMLERASRQPQGLGVIAPGNSPDHLPGIGPAGGPAPLPANQIVDFLREHSQLDRLFNTTPEGTPATAEQREQMIRKHARPLSRIIRAYQEGEQALGDTLIQGAEVQFKIGQKMWLYRHAEGDESQQVAIRGELETLVRDQVAIDLEVRQHEINNLQERIAKQQQELEQDRQRQDELVQKKLENVLEGKGDRMGQGFRKGPADEGSQPKGPRPRKLIPPPAPEEQDEAGEEE